MQLIERKQFNSLEAIAQRYKKLATEIAKRFDRRTGFWTTRPFSLLIAMSFSTDLTAEFYETTIEEISTLQQENDANLLYFVVGNDQYTQNGVRGQTRLVLHNMPYPRENFKLLSSLVLDDFYWRRTLVGEMQYNLDNQLEMDRILFGGGSLAPVINETSDTAPAYRLQSRKPIQNLNN